MGRLIRSGTRWAGWPRARWAAAGVPLLVVGGAGGLLAGCGISPEPPAVHPAAGVVAPGSSTGIKLNLGTAAGGATFPPARLSCGDQGRSFTMRGPFGVDSFVLMAEHLEPGSRLGFNFSQTFLTSVTLSISGPFLPRDYYAGPVRTGPGQSVTQGTGTLSVARSGISGRLNLTLESPSPGGAAASATVVGTWNCSHPRSSVAAPQQEPALAPAAVPPVGAECASPIQHLNSGAEGPLTCAGGAVNVLVWNYLQQYDAQVQALGPGATVAQVERAFCPPARSAFMSAAVALEIYAISADYYGWHFAVPAATVASGGGCG